MHTSYGQTNIELRERMNQIHIEEDMKKGNVVRLIMEPEGVITRNYLNKWMLLGQGVNCDQLTYGERGSWRKL